MIEFVCVALNLFKPSSTNIIDGFEYQFEDLSVDREVVLS
jgi:hypothetical protein